MGAALHPCCILAGVGPLKTPSEQSSPMQVERVETSGSSPESPVPLPVVAGEKTSTRFEHRCHRETHGIPEAPSAQSFSCHDGPLETQGSS